MQMKKWLLRETDGGLCAAEAEIKSAGGPADKPGSRLIASRCGCDKIIV